MAETTIFDEYSPSDAPSTDPTILWSSDGATLTPETAASKLINWLVESTKINLTDAVQYAYNLNNAANQGQNAEADSIIKEQLKKPKTTEKLLERSDVMDTWAPPEMPDLKALPELPSELQENIDDIEGLDDRIKDWLEALQDSFLFKYFPSDTDVSALDRLFEDILDGTAANDAQSQLDNLADLAQSRGEELKDATMSKLEASIALAESAITVDFTAGDTQLKGALDQVKVDTQNIAWARARGQVAREAARLESEAVSAMAARGFSMPNGVLMAQLDRARQATLGSASDIAAQEAVKEQTLFLDVAKDRVAAFLRAVEIRNTATIQAYRARLDGDLKFADFDMTINRDNADRVLKHLGLRLDFSKFAAGEAVRYRLGIINALTNLVRAYLGAQGQGVQQFEALANARKSAYGLMMDYYKTALDQAGIGLKVEEANLDVQLKWADTASRFIGTSVGHHIQTAFNTADLYAKMAGSTLGAVNSVATIGASE